MKDIEQHLFSVYQKFIELDRESQKAQAQRCKMDELTDCQYRYLRIIGENEPITSVQFAKLACISKPTVSQLINRFVSGGYIVKEKCPNDRRACYLRLTDKGKAITSVEKTARIHVIELINTNLSEQEVIQLIGLLDKLLNYEEEQ